MDAPLIVFRDKGYQRTRPPEGVSRGMAPAPAFDLTTEHRVWLARLGDEVLDVAWDAYEPGLCLPEVWQASLLATPGLGGGLDAAIGPLDGGPLPGDRVIAEHGPTQSVVGVWVVTGTRSTAAGDTTLGIRPVVSCLAPVPLAVAASIDDDLAEWRDRRKASVHDAASGPTLVPLRGPGLVGIMRSVGIDPRILLGPADDLADCALTNNPPRAGERRRATRVRLVESEECRAERRAVAEAFDWLVTELAAGPDLEVETIGSAGGAGRYLIARSTDAVVEAVAVGSRVLDIGELELCPTLVREARDAVDRGRSWWVIVTLDALGSGRTVALDALAIAIGFDPLTGAVARSTIGGGGELEA